MAGSVTVKLRHVRHSAKKLRPVGRLLVGQPLDRAIRQTAVMSQDSARYFQQILKMAKDAASEKALKYDQLVVSTVMANEGAKIKRMRPNSRGRANSYIKHLAHLCVTVAEKAVDAKAQPNRAKKEEK